VVNLYIENEEFIHSFDSIMVREKGVDAYLGHILKISNDEYAKIMESKNQSPTKSTEI
jgi:hypothetical protein